MSQKKKRRQLRNKWHVWIQRRIHLFLDHLVHCPPLALVPKKAILFGHPFWAIQIHPHGDLLPPCWRIMSPHHRLDECSQLELHVQPAGWWAQGKTSLPAAAPFRACPHPAACCPGKAERRSHQTLGGVRKETLSQRSTQFPSQYWSSRSSWRKTAGREVGPEAFQGRLNSTPNQIRRRLGSH